MVFQLCATSLAASSRKRRSSALDLFTRGRLINDRRSKLPSPSGAKARVFIGSGAARLKRLRKNSFNGGILDSAAEAAVDIVGFLRRDWKSRPFKASADRVFPQPLKSCPSQDRAARPRDEPTSQ